jgi:hypothetical protein
MAVVATEQSTESAGASPACAVPDGTAHAVDPGAAASRCGLPVTSLTLWPELGWPPSGMAALDVCDRCDLPAGGC